MKKLKINKKMLPILLTQLILVTTSLTGCSKNEEEQQIQVNSVGHEDISPLFNFGLDEEDFVILDIGDHNDKSVTFQNRKLNYCNDKDITLGVIISTNSDDEEGIYNDVEYVKGVLSKYTVDFPVYLDINNIITNDDLNNEMKTKLIKDFTEKCSSNNIYVGLYGTDTNLCRVNKYCKIVDYDTYLVMDSDTIKYTGVCNVVKDLEGNITSKVNLQEVINKKELNTPDEFVQDGAYYFKENDDIVDIALQYSMSVNELLGFNEMTKEEIMPGVILRIPSAVDLTIPNENLSFKVLESPIRGCDLSYAQGNNSDWDLLRQNFEFIILRCSQGLKLDRCFEENVKNCNLNNIPIGVYCYNGYTSYNCEDDIEFASNQESQADFILDNLKNKKIDYPVYLDIETPNGVSIKDRLNKEQVNIMLNNWSDKMISSGYILGIYCNQSVFKYLEECTSYSLSEKFQLWIAGGDQYTGETRDINLEDVVYPSVLSSDKFNGVVMAQATDSAIGSGAGNSLGHVDVNFSYIDYTQKEVADIETPKFEIKEFNYRIDQRDILNMFIGYGIIIAGIVIFTPKLVKSNDEKIEKIKKKKI